LSSRPRHEAPRAPLPDVPQRDETLPMRTLCAWLAGTFLASALVFAAPGCGGSSELEKTPVVAKPQNPETDMPGYKDMQDKLKKSGKIRK